MIDIKELRIGSHVVVGGRRVRVCGLTQCKVGYHATGRPGEHLRYARAREVEPIAITAELLQELAWEHKDVGYAEHWWYGSFDMTHRCDSPYWAAEGDIDLEHFHELENLYYLRYGVELVKD